MSTLRATNLKGGSAGSAPNFPDGAVITGVATVGVLSATTFYGSGANLTGIDATALKDSGGSVKVQANSTGAVVTGVLTATTGSFTGNISVGGTLTYEDVTNVDSVGMVTARNGVKVLAGGINAVGVITATSFTGSGANLTGIDALPSVSGTASGSITANKAVMLKSDGTYQGVTGAAQELGSTRTNFGRYQVVAGAYNPDLSNFAILYQDVANGNATTSVVGSISGTTVSWGTPNEARAENPGAYTMALVYDPGNDRYLGFTRDGDGSSRIRGLIGSASGTSISWTDWGNLTSFNNSEASQWYDAVWNPDTNCAAVIYRNSAARIQLAETRLSSTTTFDNTGDSIYLWNGNTYQNCYICYDTTNNVYWTCSSNSGNSWYGNVRIAKSAANLGSMTLPSSQWDLGTQKKPFGIAHDPNAGQTCVLYVNNSNGHLMLQSSTSVDTTTGVINTGTAVQLNTGNPDGGTFKGAALTYDSFAKKMVITCCWTNFTGFITAKVSSAGVISKDTMTQINSTSFHSGDDNITMVNIFDPSVNKVAAIYRDTNNMIGVGSKSGWARTITPSYSNLDADKYIGFAAESVTNGQTVKVKTKSNTVTQAGLTTATRYYVQNSDGSLGTTAAPGQSIDVGIALNSNTVLLQ